MKYLRSIPTSAAAAQPLHRAVRDFIKERPVPDAVFAAYRQMYDYDRTPLDPAVLERWMRATGLASWSGRMRPTPATACCSTSTCRSGARSPIPAVVFFPGSNAIRDRALQNLAVAPIDFLIKSGRAVLYPVYKGTYQRSDSLPPTSRTAHFYRDHVIMWAKDLRRGIDYLETRPDVDTGPLAYYGVSWGGAMGGADAGGRAADQDQRAVRRGLDFERARPEVDPVNFLPRVRSRP